MGKSFAFPVFSYYDCAVNLVKKESFVFVYYYLIIIIIIIIIIITINIGRWSLRFVLRAFLLLHSFNHKLIHCILLLLFLAFTTHCGF